MAILTNGGGTTRRRSSNSTNEEAANKARLGRSRSAAAARSRTRSTPRVGAQPRNYPTRGRSAAGRARAALGGAGRGAGVGNAARPRYAGPPPPSAAMIRQLFGQLGDFDLQGKQLASDYNLRRGQLGSARDLFLNQLGQTFTQRQQDTAQDFAARGLSESGLYNEALANLGRERAGQESAYETDYQSVLAQLLSQLTNDRAELGRRRSAVQDRYEQARADRARILAQMG